MGIGDIALAAQAIPPNNRFRLVAWRSGNAFHPINEVTVRWTGLVL